MPEQSKVIIHTDEDGEHEMTKFCWCEPRIKVCDAGEWVTVQ